MLNTSSAQANAAKRVLGFTAEYLQKEIFRIVAASVTRGKVTKVTELCGPKALSGRTPRAVVAEIRWQKSNVIYNHPMSDQPVPPPPPATPEPIVEPTTEFHIGD